MLFRIYYFPISFHTITNIFLYPWLIIVFSFSYRFISLYLSGAAFLFLKIIDLWLLLVFPFLLCVKSVTALYLVSFGFYGEPIEFPDISSRRPSELLGFIIMADRNHHHLRALTKERHKKGKALRIGNTIWLPHGSSVWYRNYEIIPGRGRRNNLI